VVGFVPVSRLTKLKEDQRKDLRKIFMPRTNNLHRVSDETKDQVATAIEIVKARFNATAEEIGRGTRKMINGAQGAAEEAQHEAGSNAKKLQSQAGVYLREQAVTTIMAAAAAGLLMSLILVFYHASRK
jgi:ElaB/YqjD/DUF883 family membrane-anchored ribosome-binding protein